VTPAELRKRAALFMAELAIADVAAGIAARTSSPDADGERPLVDALSAFLAKYAPGERWERWTAAFNAYASARRRAARSVDGAGWQAGTGIACCVTCGIDVACFPDPIVHHVLTVSHLVRAEKAKASR
jgi:hypothetical protein